MASEAVGRSARPAWSLTEDEFWPRLREAVREELAALADSSPGLLTVQEAARMCRCSTRHLLRLRAEGMPVVMVGESPRFDRDAVLAWLRSRSSK